MKNRVVTLTAITQGIILGTCAISASASSPNPVTETMTVTATKQALPLLKTDSSVIVKTGEELEKLGVTHVEDLQKVFPGFLMQTRGNRTYSSTTVRGISSPDFYSPTVSVYLDGVKQDSAFLSQQLLNVERVELLRGPQGAIYGSNAQGGVINIITRQGDEPRSRASASYSDQNQSLGLALSTSLGESFYADLTANRAHEEGYIDHLPTRGQDVNDTDETSVIGRLHYIPAGKPFKATLSIAHDDLESHEELYLTEDEYRRKQTNQDIPLLDRKVNSYALSASYQFGRHTLTSITSYQDREIYRQYIGGKWQEDQTTFSEELRLESQFEKLASIIGLYAEDRDFTGLSNGVENKINQTNYALFGQGIYSLNDNWDLTFGLRGEKTEVTSDFKGNPAWMINAYDVERSDTLWSPKVALGWQVTPASRVYISASQGNRAGGFNHVPRSNNDKQGYDAEESFNSELGWKSYFADNSISFSGAIYWIETEDIQLYVGGLGAQSLRNLGEAKSTGMEVEFGFYPTDNLTLLLSGTFGQSEFTNNNFDSGTGANYQGNQLPYAPDTTIIFSADYIVPQSVVSGELALSANIRYNSEIFFDEANTLKQDGYSLVDLAVNYQINSYVSTKLFGNNVTDQEYKTYSFSYGPTQMSNYGQEREVGLAVTVEW